MVTTTIDCNYLVNLTNNENKERIGYIWFRYRGCQLRGCLSAMRVCCACICYRMKTKGKRKLNKSDTPEGMGQ